MNMYQRGDSSGGEAFSDRVMAGVALEPLPTPTRALLVAVRMQSLRDAGSALWVAWHLGTARGWRIGPRVRVRSMALLLSVAFLLAMGGSLAAAAAAQVIERATASEQSRGPNGQTGTDERGPTKNVGGQSGTDQQGGDNDITDGGPRTDQRVDGGKDEDGQSGTDQQAPTENVDGQSGTDQPGSGQNPDDAHSGSDGHGDGQDERNGGSGTDGQDGSGRDDGQSGN